MKQIHRNPSRFLVTSKARKGKIAGITKQSIIKPGLTKTHIAIKVNSFTKKNYNRFAQDLKENLKFSKSSKYGGYQELIGKQAFIDIIKRDDYYYLVIYANKKLRNQILKILLKHFEWIKI